MHGVNLSRVELPGEAAVEPPPLDGVGEDAALQAAGEGLGERKGPASGEGELRLHGDGMAVGAPGGDEGGEDGGAGPPGEDFQAGIDRDRPPEELHLVSGAAGMLVEEKDDDLVRPEGGEGLARALPPGLGGDRVDPEVGLEAAEEVVEETVARRAGDGMDAVAAPGQLADQDEEIAVVGAGQDDPFPSRLGRPEPLLPLEADLDLGREGPVADKEEILGERLPAGEEKAGHDPLLLGGGFPGAEDQFQVDPRRPAVAADHRVGGQGEGDGDALDPGEGEAGDRALDDEEEVADGVGEDAAKGFV